MRVIPPASAASRAEAATATSPGRALDQRDVRVLLLSYPAGSGFIDRGGAMYTWCKTPAQPRH
jgi:hypothetical protein